MLGLLLLLAEAASGAPAPVPCEIVADRDEAGPLLIGQCGKSSVILGAVTNYESASNASTGAVAVVVQRGEARQVLLVRPTTDGSALLENITSDIVRRGGRAPRAGLGDLKVDLTKFAADGVIEVAAAKDSEALPSRELSLAALIAADTARLALPAEPSRVVEVKPTEQGPEAQ